MDRFCNTLFNLQCGRTYTQGQKETELSGEKCSDIYNMLKFSVTQPYIFILFNDYISTLKV
jgi:hypothetical protein